MDTPATTHHLRIFDQNVYGVPFAKDMKERTERLRQFVAQDANEDGRPDIDVAAFQELFTPSQRCRITNQFDSHPYKFMPPEIDWKFTTSGLGMISQYPIVGRKHFQHYPRTVGAASDTLANKGMAHICIRHPTLGLIDIFDTHTQAAYDHTDQYEEVRAGQVVALAKFVKVHAKPDHLSIICGDMNMIRGSTVDQIFHLLFKDYIDVMEAKNPEGVPPTYRRDNPLVCPDQTNCDEKDQALDYIFVRAPSGMQIAMGETSIANITGTNTGLISDHDGILLDLALTGTPPPVPEVKTKRGLLDALKKPRK